MTLLSLCKSLSNLRDLSDMRNELARASHSAQVSCTGLSASLHSREGGAAMAMEQEKALRVQLEQQLRERVAEMMNLQTRTDAERSELNIRLVSRIKLSYSCYSFNRICLKKKVCFIRLSDSVREAEKLKGQIEEKDREIVLLTRRLEVRCLSLCFFSCQQIPTILLKRIS